MPNTYTILQIAEAAGVGTATVDRVLNNRPGVNPATVEKVQQVMQKLGAETPARGRPRSMPSMYKFAFVLPAARQGMFDSLDRMIAQMAGDFRHQHITEVTHRIATDDIQAFASELASMTDHDGIAVLAPDMPPVKMAINELIRAGVHVVTLYSDVPGSMRETFIGADNKAAGRTAALLLGHGLHHRPQARCVMLSYATRYAAEIDRAIGFAQLLEEQFPDVSCVHLTEMPEDDDEAFAFVRQALAPTALGGPVTAVHVVTSGSQGVARAIQELGIGRPIVAAHDLFELHRSLLLSGSLTYVLHQDAHYTVSTAARVLRSLCEGVRGALSVSNPRVEIATVENLA